MTPLFHLRRRLYSTQPPPSSAASTKPTSPHIGFYKSFGRPVAKVLLGAVCTYQLVYYLWVKLEAEEMKEMKNEEIKGLKAQLQAAKTHR